MYSSRSHGNLDFMCHVLASASHVSSQLNNSLVPSVVSLPVLRYVNVQIRHRVQLQVRVSFQ